MRHRFLVCYDVADPRRLARTYRKMNGFGEPAQYSVFICDLSPKERGIAGGGLDGNPESEGGPGVDCGHGSLGRAGPREFHHPGKRTGVAPPERSDNMTGHQAALCCERSGGEAVMLDPLAASRSGRIKSGLGHTGVIIYPVTGSCGKARFCMNPWRRRATKGRFHR